VKFDPCGIVAFDVIKVFVACLAGRVFAEFVLMAMSNDASLGSGLCQQRSGIKQNRSDFPHIISVPFPLSRLRALAFFFFLSLFSQ
jgi:hypothetical protein